MTHTSEQELTPLDNTPAKSGGFTLNFRTASPVYTPLIDLVPADAQYADSDEGNASRFLDIYKEKVRYCESEKCWYVFDNMRWKIDDTKAVQAMARDALYTSYTKEIESTPSGIVMLVKLLQPLNA